MKISPEGSASGGPYARHLGRAPSTISREVRRNGRTDPYRTAASDQAGWDRALPLKPCELACYPALSRMVLMELQRNSASRPIWPYFACCGRG
ncbi:helix-turn-helix domain-containing protein [Oricola cellulosilytica]|uniref:helix-turn-helix domain-containing protein n=1 Tax=Oricola cellulosilytica TaxID=1429082 RepID=UPI0018EEAA8F